MNLLENMVEELYENQNVGAAPEQQGLYTKKQYFELLKPVVDIIANHKDLSDKRKNFI